MSKWVAAFMLSLTFFAGPAHAECYVGSFRFYAGTDASTIMRVTSGKNCRVIVFASALSRFDNIAITERPKHGTLSPHMGVGVSYKSAAGFKGDDDFLFTVVGEMVHGNAARIKVHVTVL